jgi:hypothetical protein
VYPFEVVAPNAYDALVEQAIGAVRRLADARPLSASARDAAEELTAQWRRRPFTIGLAGGSVAPRTELLDQLCGGGMLEQDGRVPGCAPIRVRRGHTTRFRATRRDGTCEDMSLPPPPPPVPDRNPQAETARAEVAVRQAAAERADAAVPRLVRVPPPRWAFWWWLVRWLLLLTSRRAIARSVRARADHARSRRELAAAEQNEAPVASPPDAREQFLKRLYVLCSGMLAGRDVQRIEIEVADGPLPSDVEVIETATRDDVDELVTLTDGAVPLAGTDRRLGTIAEVIASLGTLPGETRALRLVRRASEIVAAEVVKLDEVVERTEIELRNRIARLENLRLHDADRFVETQVARVSRQVGASIHAVLEHAGVHLSSELAQCAAAWGALVDAAPTSDALRVAAAKIDEEAPIVARRIADETRILVMGGVGGCAHDLLPELFAPLREPGLPEEYARPPRGAPALPAVELLPSLANPSTSHFAGDLAGAGPWLAGLFRSIDARRADLRAKVHQRAHHIREVAEAEMLDAEPRLRAALRETVARELSAAVERRVAWVAQQLAAEELAVDAERRALRPLTEVLDDARRDARRLYALLSEREDPLAALASAT